MIFTQGTREIHLHPYNDPHSSQLHYVYQLSIMHHKNTVKVKQGRNYFLFFRFFLITKKQIVSMTLLIVPDTSLLMVIQKKGQRIMALLGVSIKSEIRSWNFYSKYCILHRLCKQRTTEPGSSGGHYFMG